jgi:hypothetical protein
MRLVLVAVVLLPFAGCGGTATNGSGSTPGSAQAYCDAELAWRDRCNASNVNCDVYGVECFARVYRPEALAQMRDCELQHPCSGGKEHCIEEASLPTPLASGAEFKTACEAKQLECEGQIVGDNAFFCFDLSPNTDEYVAVMRSCLDEACSAIRGCMDQGKLDAFCAM